MMQGCNVQPMMQGSQHAQSSSDSDSSSARANRTKRRRKSSAPEPSDRDSSDQATEISRAYTYPGGDKKSS